MNLLEISKLILSEKKNKKKNIFFVIPFPWEILDFFLSKFPHLLNLFEKGLKIDHKLIFSQKFFNNLSNGSPVRFEIIPLIEPA